MAAGDPPNYQTGGSKVPIGSAATLRLPVHAYRGRLTGMFFETSKCFLLPSVIHGLQGLVDYFLDHPGCHVLVVGHTDARGDAAYNLTLSEERADAIAAFLREDAGAWMAWFGAGKPGDKRWGTREVQHMLSALPRDGERFYEGEPSGVEDAATRSAVKQFQRSAGLTEDGNAKDATTREALVKAYLAIDGTSLPAGTPLETHGCGEHHPAVPGKTDEPKNRRAEVFLFVGPIEPAAKKCAAPGCAEYPKWVAACIETLDLGDGPLSESRKLQFTLSGDGCELVILDESGAETQVLRPAQASAADGWLTYTVDPVTLPNPARFVRRSAGCEEHVGGPCDPIALRDALRHQAWDEVNQLLGGAPVEELAVVDHEPEFQDDHL